MKWTMTIGNRPKYVSFHWNTRIIEITNTGVYEVWVGYDNTVTKMKGLWLAPVEEGRAYGGTITITMVANAPIRGVYLVVPDPKNGKSEVEVIWTEKI